MILDKIAKNTVDRVNSLKNIKSFEQVKKQAEAIEITQPFCFEKELQTSDMAFICEVKKASPSKGIISESFPYLKIALEYEKAGASAISVLTEPNFFMGSDKYLSEIKQSVSIPILRKDFTIDSYQIYEAKVIGADAVLLICSLLDTYKLKEYIKIANSLGLSALVETHTSEEVESALNAGARIIGVNNRNLQTFNVDINSSIELKKLIPDGVICVSESGIKTASDIKILRENKFDAVLIGETFMKSDNIAEEFLKLRGEVF